MFLNFSDPSIIHLGDANFAPEKALIFEDYGPDDWVYLIIEGSPSINNTKKFAPLYHPVSNLPLEIADSMQPSDTCLPDPSSRP